MLQIVRINTEFNSLCDNLEGVHSQPCTAENTTVPTGDLWKC